MVVWQQPQEAHGQPADHKLVPGVGFRKPLLEPGKLGGAQHRPRRPQPADARVVGEGSAEDQIVGIKRSLAGGPGAGGAVLPYVQQEELGPRSVPEATIGAELVARYSLTADGHVLEERPVGGKQPLPRSVRTGIAARVVVRHLVVGPADPYRGVGQQPAKVRVTAVLTVVGAGVL